MCAALVALLDILLAAGWAAVLLLPGRQQLFALGIIFLYETRCASQRSNHHNHAQDRAVAASAQGASTLSVHRCASLPC